VKTGRDCSRHIFSKENPTMTGDMDDFSPVIQHSAWISSEYDMEADAPIPRGGSITLSVHKPAIRLAVPWGGPHAEERSLLSTLREIFIIQL
jgi:hypothetical protein